MKANGQQRDRPSHKKLAKCDSFLQNRKISKNQWVVWNKNASLSNLSLNATNATVQHFNKVGLLMERRNSSYHQARLMGFCLRYCYESTKILIYIKFTISCQNLKPAQIADFIWISKIKTPSPEPETGSYDPSIRSPF